VKAVIHFADGPDHAMLAGARVRGGLERCLIRAQARFLVYLGARIPEQNLRGDVAGDWLAAGVLRNSPSWGMTGVDALRIAWLSITPERSRSSSFWILYLPIFYIRK
jgi:hypothetical protein